MPQTKLLQLLHESLTHTGEDIDVLVARLASIAEQDGDPATAEVVALGFVACVKALRESSLIQEVAIREEIQEIHTLGGDLLQAIKRTEAINRRLLNSQAANAEVGGHTQGRLDSPRIRGQGANSPPAPLAQARLTVREPLGGRRPRETSACRLLAVRRQGARERGSDGGHRGSWLTASAPA